MSEEIAPGEDALPGDTELTYWHKGLIWCRGCGAAGCFELSSQDDPRAIRDGDGNWARCRLCRMAAELGE